MSQSDKNYDDLCVIGRSPFVEYCDNFTDKSNCHRNCISSFKRHNSLDESIPDQNHCWYLSDHHIDHELKTYQSLKKINDLGQQINAIQYDSCEKNIDVITPVDIDPLAKEYFPVTLGKAFQIEAQITSDANPPWSVTFSPPGTGLPHPTSPWRLPTPHNRAELTENSYWLPAEQHLRESRHFISNSLTPADCIQTPFQSELTKLRLDRLRLEDEILMEVKRQSELERIRGPEPKWYELRDSRFHYEARKNNELLQRSDSWQKLFDYRNSLKRKSEEFREKYSHCEKKYDPTNYISVS